MTALRLLTIAVATALVWQPQVASAQDQWVAGSSPVFRSDVERREQAEEARRAERRKAAGTVTYPKFMNGGEKPDIAPEKPPIVYLDKDEPAGMVIVDTGGRRLLYTLPGKRAYAYPISVGRDGFTWTGTEKISRIAAWPTWTPPPEMRQRQPGLPITVTGGLINPLGAKALYLGNTIYRIHGTNNDRSIGRASSSGCFRMMNQHVVHLATLARVGTTVRVVANYSGVSESAPMSSIFSAFLPADSPAPVAATAKQQKKKPKTKTSQQKNGPRAAAAQTPASQTPVSVAR
jgi:lipoprotein-anchoring transpeptidase ErfK/SrfK